jgi:hypothetical protein
MMAIVYGYLYIRKIDIQLFRSLNLNLNHVSVQACLLGE